VKKRQNVNNGFENGTTQENTKGKENIEGERGIVRHTYQKTCSKKTFSNEGDVNCQGHGTQNGEVA